MVAENYLERIAQLPSIRAEMDRFGIQPTKAFGQNFLLDQNITDKIVRLSGVSEHDDVIEVGPGPGGLTRSLLKTGAQITAIEKDPALLELLYNLQSISANHLNIRNEDALISDMTALKAEDRPLKIVANLPYNVATPLLTNWLATAWPPYFSSMTLMFQKEVADRIVAQPKEKAFGRLAILAQWRCHANIVMKLPPEAFTPPPKVNSAVVHFTPKTLDQNAPKVSSVEQVTQAIFHQRRKKIRAGLKHIFHDVDSILQQAGIDPNIRGETLEIEAFLQLAKLLEEQK